MKPLSLYGAIWTTWWLGDAAGILVLAPMLLVWGGDPPRDVRAADLVRPLGALAGLLALAVLHFSAWVDVPFFSAQAYLLLPVLLWIVFRFGARTATVAVVLVSAVAILATTHGRGPFVRPDANESLLVLQGFVAVVSVTVLFLGSALGERRLALEEVAGARDDLERRVLERTDELSRANAELARSNADLDDFAYIASHDLKEPLRGIASVVSFVREDYGERLGADGVRELERLPKMTAALETMIEGLLGYSRVGRADLAVGDIPLDEVVDEVLVTLQPRLDQERIAVRRPRPLPTVRCDRVRVAEVWRNLLSNAIKYNEKAERWIEVGWREGDPPVFFVADNGIGIKPQHLDRVFQLFRRLHGRDKYGGGTGIGLTISKKIVERHGGRIRVESTFGEGATFLFTLAKEPTA